jgi:hypothetical protein
LYSMESRHEMTHTRKQLEALWKKWKAIAPELTYFWFDEERREWMGGEMMCCDEKDREFHHEFYMGDVIPQAADYIREHMAKEAKS